MKVLVACEESQAVCKAFREKGHEAYSCDIQDCSGGCPEWHIKGDVLPLLNGNCEIITADGKTHSIQGKWDLIIAHPPCTHICVSGARHFEKKRADGRQKEGIEFFCKFLNADCDKIAIENPVGIISGEYIKTYFPTIAKKYGLPLKPSQTVQPYEYGHESRKATCLWLKNLPLLKPTNIVEPVLKTYQCKNGKIAIFSEDYGKTTIKGNRQKSRCKTFDGIAKAMAEQWG